MSTKPPMPHESTECADALQVCMDGFEIYVPKDADVRLLPIQNLPTSIVKRIALFSTSESIDMRSNMVTCISPVVIREKGSQGRIPISRCGDGAWSRLSAAAGTCVTTSRGPQDQCWLPVACSNLTAFKVLRQFLPHRRGQQWDSAQEETLKASSPTPVPHGCLLRFCQDAIIIYRGRIFLSIMKAVPGQRRAEQRKRTGPEAPPRQSTPCMVNSHQMASDSSAPPSPFYKPTCSSSTAERAPSLQALRKRFGITHRAQVNLLKLPATTLKRQWTAGLGCPGEHTPSGWLGNVVRQQESSWKSLLSAGLHGSSLLQEAGCRGSEDTSGSSSCEGRHEADHDCSKSVQGTELKEPMTKKARLAPLSQLCFDETGKGGDEEEEDRGAYGKAMGRHPARGVIKGGDPDRSVAKVGDPSRVVAEGEDLSRVVAEGEDLSRVVAEGEDLSRVVVEGEDTSSVVAESRDLGEGVADRDVTEDGDIGKHVGESRDPDEGLDEGGEPGQGIAEGRDLTEFDTESGDPSELEVEVGSRDLCENECRGEGEERVKGKDETEDEEHSQDVCVPSYLSVSSLEYAAEFDFEQSAREEKINRIRAQLREKEEALRSLRPPV